MERKMVGVAGLVHEGRLGTRQLGVHRMGPLSGSGCEPREVGASPRDRPDATGAQGPLVLG